MDRDISVTANGLRSSDDEGDALQNRRPSTSTETATMSHVDHHVDEHSEGHQSDSDSDSIYEDLLNSEDADRYVRTADPTICSPEEADKFRAMLRELGPNDFIYQTISAGTVTAAKMCAAFGVKLPEWMQDRPDENNYRLLGLLIIRELTRRRKLPQYNSFDDAVDLLQRSKKIVVITGAGISTNLGIPDFRSKENGFYVKLREEGFDDPQSIFEIRSFDEDPRPFYYYASETLPMKGKSSPTHGFIRLLQDRDQLLTNYTQNIDNVEGNVGIDSDRLIQCHGSWATFTCRKCGHKAPGEQFHARVQAKNVPKCPKCIETMQNGSTASLKRKRNGHSKPRKRHTDDDSSDDGQYDIPEPGVMKPDITFFGEKLPDTFFDRFKTRDRYEVDLLVVIGTSMKVAPVSEIPIAIRPDVPQIFISRDPCLHLQFDIALLGDCDVITSELAKRAGWSLEHDMLPKEREVDVLQVDRDSGVWKVLPRTANTHDDDEVNGTTTTRERSVSV